MEESADIPADLCIIGGGAGGLELALRLARHGTRCKHRITLIDQTPKHLWKPRLHEVATGLLVAAEEAASFAELAAKHGFVFIQGEVRTLNWPGRCIELAPVPVPDRRLGGSEAQLLPARTLHYQIAVLALGSTINDFGIPGVRENCYTLDSLSDAQQLHEAMLALAMRVQAGEQRSLSVAIVGAGTTGIELAGELRNAVQNLSAFRSLMTAEQLRVQVFEMAERPLPTGDVATSDRVRRSLEGHGIGMRFKSKVERVEAGRLTLAGGEQIEADLIVWASGVHGRSRGVLTPGLQIQSGDRIRVDENLRVLTQAGEVLTSLYCIGDCAAFIQRASTVPLGATAQVAEQQARALARSLRRQFEGRSAEPFHYQDRGTLVSLGRAVAVGYIALPGQRSFTVGGRAAKAAYVSLYRLHLVTLYGWWRTALITVAGFLRRSALPTVKLPW